MFQGSPNESIRNRIPFGFDPADARRGRPDPRPPRPLRAAAAAGQGRASAARSTPPPARSSWRRSSCSTPGTSTRSSPSARPAGRSATPTKSTADDARKRRTTRRRVDLAAAGGSEEERRSRPPAHRPPSVATPGRRRRASASASTSTTTHRARTAGRLAARPRGGPARASRPPSTSTSTQPLYTVKDAERTLEHFRPIGYGEEREVAPGVRATFLDAGHILGSAIIRLRVQDRTAARSA